MALSNAVLHSDETLLIIKWVDSEKVEMNHAVEVLAMSTELLWVYHLPIMYHRMLAGSLSRYTCIARDPSYTCIARDPSYVQLDRTFENKEHAKV